MANIVVASLEIAQDIEINSTALPDLARRWEDTHLQAVAELVTEDPDRAAQHTMIDPRMSEHLFI